jgi:pimeloyl-ACP methyl ester carboxylesterase
MRGEFIDVGGVRLYYYAAGSRGSGEPIILLHGFPTSGHVWSGVVPLLPTGHRVVVLDLLGFGRSDPPGSEELSVSSHAARVVALMDVLGIRKATLVGHHLGGGIAQATALHWPDRVTRLALLDSIGFDVTVTGTLALMRAFLQLARFLPTRTLLRVVGSDLLHRYVDAERGRHSISQYLRPFESDGGGRVFLRHLSAFSERETIDLALELGRLRVPTALVWGANDAFVPPSLARRLRSALPHATLDIIEDVRHFTPEEAPERVAAVIGNLLRR